MLLQVQKNLVFPNDGTELSGDDLLLGNIFDAAETVIVYWSLLKPTIALSSRKKKRKGAKEKPNSKKKRR